MYCACWFLVFACCLDYIKKWFPANKFKLNPDKTEFIIFGSKIQHEKLNKSFPVNILGNFLSPVGVLRNLGVWFDSDFSFLSHVQNICKSSFAQIRDLKLLKSYLRCHAALMAVNALVGSQIDYCILWLEVSQLLIFVSCNVFKIVWLELLPTPLTTHTSLLLGRLSIGCLLNTVPYLRLLYWCTNSCIVVIQNILYLSLNLDIVFITCKSQADGVFLEVPHFATSIYKSSKHFGLSFAYDAPKVWNDLPDDASLATSLHSFKQNLKTYLFAPAYPPEFLLFPVSLRGADPCYVSG